MKVPAGDELIELVSHLVKRGDWGWSWVFAELVWVFYLSEGCF